MSVDEKIRLGILALGLVTTISLALIQGTLPVTPLEVTGGGGASG